MTVMYLDHLPTEYCSQGLGLFLDSLRDKLIPVLGDGDQAESLLADQLDPAQCLTAICDGKVGGVLAIQTQTGSFLNPTLRSLIREYGWVKGLFRFGGLCCMHHMPEADEWYVDGVAVSPELRGLGIGSGLMDLLEQKAKQENIRHLSLDVIDTNPKAYSLYERLGYTEVRRSGLWPVGSMFGFSFTSTIHMVKTLSETDADCEHYDYAHAGDS